MSYETLDIRVDDRGVAYVTLNRPDKRNVLSAQMIAELTEMAHRLGAASDTRAIVLSGAGRMFCAGGDLAWMKAQIDADRDTRIREAGKLAAMLHALNTMPTPLIGRIHGGAFGGGVGMACVCDVAIAEETTQFGLTETRLGLIPATIGPYVLARMGEGKARRVFMSARLFDAPEAASLGIVARSVAADDLDDAVEAEVAPYLSVAPGAVGAAKALARALGPRIDAEVIDELDQPAGGCLGHRRSRAGHRRLSGKAPRSLDGVVAAGSDPLDHEIRRDARAHHGMRHVEPGERTEARHQRGGETGLCTAENVGVQRVPDHEHLAGGRRVIQSRQGKVEDVGKRLAEEPGRDAGRIGKPVREPAGLSREARLARRDQIGIADQHGARVFVQRSLRAEIDARRSNRRNRPAETLRSARRDRAPWTGTPRRWLAKSPNSSPAGSIIPQRRTGSAFRPCSKASRLVTTSCGVKSNPSAA